MSAHQVSFPTVYMRGGTSRALFFKVSDLPAERAAWDAIFCAALGTPDPHGRQLDGMGGGISSLSKIAIIGPSTRADADIDYTFAQVPIGSTVVQYKGNCGNISSAVGPFAVDEGLVPVEGDAATVRIHNTNTGKVIVSKFPLAGGRAAVDGDFVLTGVAGAGAPVRLSFLEPGGAVTGKLLPTGMRKEMLELEGFPSVEVSVVDAANPVVMLRADAIGLHGGEKPSELDANQRVLEHCEAIRRAAAVRIGIARDLADARERVRSLPQVALLSPPAVQGCHLRVRVMSTGQPHRATPLTGGMCVATALQLQGTVADAVGLRPQGEDVAIEHPSGTLHVAAKLEQREGEPFVAETAVYRTARRLMEGSVFVPVSKILEAKP
ncbi:PrpF family protein [Ramlibacter sp. G-1-2-2]|uniref:PrpF family protein n=1 Tax=Ramlibacter agri TaxID=2728837 RepID=A0A848H5C6_9BURK|nr:PrpF domain-containing protein [Ramlibacter agri]NML44440.1 PrpF family protein [Ramlibacter agri]